MPKYHKIKWTKQDQQELAKAVRNYNAKVNRLAKNPSRLLTEEFKALGMTERRIKYALPEKTSVKALKELINTRQDLKREINALKRFSKRGSEKMELIPDTDNNIIVTSWQRKEMNRRVAMINRKRKRRLSEIAEMEMTSRGEELGYTRGQIGMGKVEELSLRPMKAFTQSISQTGVKWKWEGILEESQSDYFNQKDEEVRQNYIKGIKEHYDYESVKDIIEHIEKVDIKEFFKVFNREGATFDIASPDGYDDFKFSEYQGYEEALRSTWLPKSSKGSERIITEELTKRGKKPKKTKSKKSKR